MTAVYDKLGLKFLYPENWRLTDDPDSDPPRVITLENPDGSVTWSAHVYPAVTDTGESTDSDSVLKATLATLQESYEDLEISPDQQELGGFSASGVEVLFYCLDFLVRAQLHIVRAKEHLLLFWTQAEDRAFEAQHIVFKAISTSLLQSLTAIED